MNRKFKPPRQADEQQWKKVRFLYERGYRFQTVYDQNGVSVPYPETLEEARDFVRRNSPRRAEHRIAARAEGEPSSRLVSSSPTPKA
jgi:hypothetical protein